MTNQASYRVMIVEDNDFVRMQISRFLVEGGHTCVDAASADQALERWDEAIDLVLADVRMEPADGFDLVTAMRAREYEQPVILVTGDQNPDLLERASRMGIATVLMKPVQKERLLAMVDRTMTQQRRAM